MPADLKAGKAYPVVFTLHGKGSDEQNMFGLVEPLAEQCIIVGIRGNLPLGPGYQYYDLISLGNPIREMFDAAVHGLEFLIEKVTKDYPIDPARRYIVGFSQGAILAMTLALTMGDKRLKGIASLSGYIPEFVKEEYPLQSLKNLSVFVSHGEYDSVFPIHVGHATADFLKKQTEHVNLYTYTANHEVSEKNQTDLLYWLRRSAELL